MLVYVEHTLPKVSYVRVGLVPNGNNSDIIRETSPKMRPCQNAGKGTRSYVYPRTKRLSVGSSFRSEA
jgi:hypothetical protein